MANWSNPTITSQYDVFVQEAKDRDVDSATLFLAAPTNPVVGMVRFNRTTKVFEEWSGTAWVVLVMGITGGGTGANSGAGAGTALGLGSMAYQNSNAVSISAGSITGLTVFTVATSPLPTVDNTYNLGALAQRWKNAYIGTGLVIPVGTDKYVTS